MSAPRGITRIGDQLAHVVGYVAPPNEADVDDDPMLALPGIRVGRAGMEKHHDLDLRGRAGAVQLEVNAVGRVIRELDRQEGIAGRGLGLTIDAGCSRRCSTTSATRAPAPWCWTAATAKCWRWPPTRRSIRRCSIPAYRRRNG